MKYESEKGDGNYLTHLLFESIDFKNTSCGYNLDKAVRHSSI